MSLVAGKDSPVLDSGAALEPANKSSIIERCKALASLISLSFLCLAGCEKQNTVGTASGLRVGLFRPKPSTTLDTKSCSVK